MAFVVETGTGISNANAYMSVAAFKAYHDDRGQSYSAYSDAQIEKALVLASDYLDLRFSFIGYRTLQTQAMEWPRTNAYYSDGRGATGVPVEVSEACAEYALRALANPLVPDPVTDSSGRLVTSETKTVGPLSTSKDFSNVGSPTAFRPYPVADKRLRELVHDGNRVLRA